MGPKEEIGAAAQALAQQLIDLAAKETAREEFNKLMLSAQDLLLLDDRLTADPDRGPDEYPDVLAPLFAVVYTGEDPVNYGDGPVDVLVDGVVVSTLDPETDPFPEPIPVPTGDGIPLTEEELSSVVESEPPLDTPIPTEDI